MKRRMMRKIAVLVTGSALALSFPVASSVANPGGVPNGGVGSGKTCKKKGKGVTKKTLSDLPSRAQNTGSKCGFHKQENGLQPENGQGQEHGQGAGARRLAGGRTRLAVRGSGALIERPGFVLGRRSF
jgi:hypothetical protein